MHALGTPLLSHWSFSTEKKSSMDNETWKSKETLTRVVQENV